METYNSITLVELVRRGQFEAAHLPMDRRSVHSPLARDAGDVPVIGAQGSQQARSRVGGSWRRMLGLWPPVSASGPGNALWQIVYLNDAVGRDRTGVVDAVAQFADIAWPRISAKRIKCRRRQAVTTPRSADMRASRRSISHSRSARWRNAGRLRTAPFSRK